VRRLLLLLSLLALLISAAAVSAQVVHIVQPGDTLFRIAMRYNANVYDIAEANHLLNLNRIYVGQALIIPGGGYPPPTYPTPVPPQPTIYIVRPGDRLADIARLYNTTVQAISAANGILNPNYIFPGQRLIIPGYTPPPPVVTSYTVQYGDNLTAIAYRFGTTPEALASYNAIPFPYYIYPGQVLLIPR
jgi:LysM repeat protein